MRSGEDLVGENKNVLTGNNFKKGDLIQVRVTPSDGKADGKPFSSDPLKILNSPPVIQEVRIGPTPASASDDLKILVKGFDPDGDSVGYTFQWEKNGTILSEKTKDILEKGEFKKGDSIAVIVTPDDGESKGISKKSGPIVVTNSPPIIVSTPAKTEGNTYTYQVKAEDADHEPVTFRLKTAPKGMEIDKETGLIRWTIRKEDSGAQLVEIEASDSEGARSIQRFTLSTGLR
ncbi:MAG TPA: Ig domain-containing protein [Thermodesulfobacteriota bacterium]|nr:Ig domain-containing protein [Thermodesulfobacteriota bacterium]